MEIDIVYDRNVIYYNNEADCIIAAWLLKKYLQETVGTTPITYKMNKGDGYRLELMNDETTIWIIGLPINENDEQFMNRYASKVKWIYNDIKLKKTTLTGYTIYNNTGLYSQFIHNKYYGKTNKFMDEFIDKKEYYTLLINDINQIEEYYNGKTNIEEYELYKKISETIVEKIKGNNYIKKYDDYTYYLIYDNCCTEEIKNKILKLEDVLLVLYKIQNIGTITYKVYSNKFKVINKEGKTDTLNTLFLDIPNEMQ